MRVGFYQPDGTPLLGYSLQECKALTGDQINQTVLWEKDSGNRVDKTNADISQLLEDNSVVQIKVELKNSDLFSLQFQPM